MYRLSSLLYRGPLDGYRGKVVLPCEENENGLAKVGVQFDTPITGGNDLGGKCEMEYGFFCPGNCLDHVPSFQLFKRLL